MCRTARTGTKKGTKHSIWMQIQIYLIYLSSCISAAASCMHTDRRLFLIRHKAVSSDDLTTRSNEHFCFPFMSVPIDISSSSVHGFPIIYILPSLIFHCVTHSKYTLIFTRFNRVSKKKKKICSVIL